MNTPLKIIKNTKIAKIPVNRMLNQIISILSFNRINNFFNRCNDCINCDLKHICGNTNNEYKR
jgi:hypothetical protein